MQTIPRSVTKFLLLSALMLVWTGSALAQRNIIVDSVTVTVSSLNTPIPLTAADTILVRNGGTLFVNADATISSLTMGDATSAGNVTFQGNLPTVTLTVANDVTFGPNALNLLDMTLAVAHTLKVGGNFLAAGQGSIKAGAATIEYNNPANQFVTARIGGSGAIIQYNNLTLSGALSTNAAVKNFASGVSVQGTLLITGQAVPSGGSVTYGPLATLNYNGIVPQTTTPTEWPAAPFVLNAPVTINNPGLTLDSDKTIAAIFPNSLILQSGILNDGGHTLTVQGNVLNNSGCALQGSGKLVLGGTGNQFLTGTGTYGNLVLANNATSSLPVSVTQPQIQGRLTINSGSKLNLPSSHFASLLTTNGVDAAATSYGSTASGASVKNNSLFDSSAPGVLTVNAKPTPTVTTTPQPGGFVIIYGTSTFSMTGTVVPPSSPVNFSLYGNGALNGDAVSNAVFNGTSLIASNVVFVGPSGTFAVTFNTGAFAAGSYTIISYYQGGINLAPGDNTATAPALTVNVRHIGVIPTAGQSKIYGSADPVSPLPYDPTPTLAFTITNTLVNGDLFTGALGRVAGENVSGGGYVINQGGVLLSANYFIDFTAGVVFTINPKPISVTLISTNELYGANDAVLTGGSNINYTISPQPLVGNDQMAGNVGRAPGTNAGPLGTQYQLNLGNLTAGPLGGTNYALSAANTAFLTINPLPVTVTFFNAQKTYGDPDPSPATEPGNPRMTYTYTPTPLPDNFISNYTTNRDLSTVPAGQTVAGSPYIIRQGSAVGAGNVVIAGGKGSNYVFTFTTSGVLTINKKTVYVSAINTNKVYGAAVPAYINYSGFIMSPQNGVPGTNAPAVQATTSPNPPVTPCSLPGITNFTITSYGSDPNYTMVQAIPPADSGSVTVTLAPLTITAQNQSQNAGPNPFPTNNYASYQFGYPVSVNGLQTACGDTVSNWFSSGALVFTGSATTSNAPGVYPIMPTGLLSTKYNVTYVGGWVTISTTPGSTTNSANLVTWAGPVGGSPSGSNPGATTNLTFMINNANFGTAGANPGWSLLKLTGPNSLNIVATPTDQFRVDLVTLTGSQAGNMAKFDPTRPYSWQIVQTAHGISGFNAAAFNLNWQAVSNQAPNLFQNPIFNNIPGTQVPSGTFQISCPDNQNIWVNFTPMGYTAGSPPPIPIPSGFDVGTTTNDTTKLLGSVANSDLPVLWLQPSATSIAPQSPVTINLNVANLQLNPIIGVDAYLNFSSSQYVATNGPFGPQVQVAPGGGPWQQIIVKTWSVTGDLDTVVAVSLTNTAGTSADGTVAMITLTPTRNAVGTSRVVFREDGGTNSSGVGQITTDLVPLSGVPVLPARVMTDEITITGAGVKPVISGIAATQLQPLYGTNSNVNVAGGAFQKGTQVIATSPGISATTASGPVFITLTATDAGGVGLNGPPTVVLNNGVGSLVCTNPTATTGTFGYLWNVPASAVQGAYTATITATDRIGNQATDTSLKLSVNTYEVSGVVDLQSFLPGVNNSGVLLTSNRMVTFNAGGVAGVLNSNMWNLNLNFVSGPILNAGAFLDVSYVAAQVNTPTNTMSTWLRYGTILNLPSLAGAINNQRNPQGVSTYLYTLFYGSFASLSTVAGQLTTPTRNIDTYVLSWLQPTTVAALAVYQANPSPANAANLSKNLLNDFNSIVLSTNIYDPVRFAGVPGAGSCTGPNTVAINRCLLASAYMTGNYAGVNYGPGQLSPQTAQKLFSYPGSGYDPVLAADLLTDFDTLTVSPAMWPIPTHPLDQGIYNQTVFLGVTLSPTTSQMLQTPQTGPQLTLLNQLLLQDAYPGQFQKAPLAPQTVLDAVGYPANAALFTPAITADLNSLINSGTNIYNTLNAWTSFTGAIQSNPELAALLAVSSPTAAQIVRMNRLLFETGYTYINPVTFATINALTTSELATYRLVQAPSTATQISAKTTSNLRVTKSGVTFTGNSATLNFVSGGAPVPFNAAKDSYLRGGDVNNDNTVNLLDYNLLRANWLTTTSGPTDVNGNGVVDIYDYSLLQLNYGASGDSPVTN